MNFVFCITSDEGITLNARRVTKKLKNSYESDYMIISHSFHTTHKMFFDAPKTAHTILVYIVKIIA